MTIAAFMAVALAHLLDNPKPVMLFSAIITGTALPAPPLWFFGTLPAVVLLGNANRNAPFVRVFALESRRAIHISLKAIVERTLGGLPGVKIVSI